jgi:hypothetical protein
MKRRAWAYCGVPAVVCASAVYTGWQVSIITYPQWGVMLLVAAARAWALLAGRPMVVPEHVQAVFPSVAGHRLAGGARAGALQAKALLRAIAVP